MFGIFHKPQQTYDHLDLTPDFGSNESQATSPDVLTDWMTAQDVWSNLSDEERQDLYKYEPAAYRRGMIRAQMINLRPIYINGANRLVRNQMPTATATELAAMVSAVVNTAMRQQYQTMVDEAEVAAYKQEQEQLPAQRHQEMIATLQGIQKSINDLNIVGKGAELVKTHPFLTGLLLP